MVEIMNKKMCVLGLGYIALLIVLFAQAKLNVVGVDIIKMLFAP